MAGVAQPASFGELLRQHRLDAGLTQAALGERAGVSVRAIQHLERSVGRPQRETAHRLAEALALTAERLIQFEQAAVPVPRKREVPGVPPRQAVHMNRPDWRRSDVVSGTPKHFGGEHKRVTVLASAISGLGDMGEDIDADLADELLAGVIPLLVDVVHRHGGMVDRVSGDGITGLFGVPLAREDDAIRACSAALALHEAFDRYAERVEEQYGPRMGLRIGLDSGAVLVRTANQDAYGGFVAIGTSVRLATRLGQHAPHGTTLLTRETLRSVEAHFLVRPLDTMAVNGSAAPIDAFRLAGARPPGSRFSRFARTRRLTRFVGRATELGSLAAPLDDVREGRGQVVAVVGEPGVGKSRLVWEATRKCPTDEWLLLEVGAGTHGSPTPYQPVIDLLKGYFGIEAADDVAIIQEKVAEGILGLDHALRPDLPALLSLLDAAAGDPSWEVLDPPRRRRRTLDALKRLMLRKSEERPLLLLFEDLHWIDAETQAFLDILVDGLPAARILLLVTYRPEYEHHWGAKTYYTHLRIDALPSVVAGELLDALLGDDAALRPLKQALIGRTDGNALFLEESVRTLVEAGILRGKRGAYRQSGRIDTLGVPGTIQTILAARIDHLEPEPKRILQTAAVIGRDVPLVLLAAIADVSDADLHDSLARLQEAELVYEARLFPNLEYTFKHALTHDVAYGSLLREHRRSLHARIADAIERLCGERLEEHIGLVAHHALHGEAWAKAVAYCRQAGLKATARSANRQAIGYLEQALAALGHLDKHRETLEQAIDLRLDLRAALIPIGSFQRVLELLGEARDIAEALGDQRRLGQTLAFMQYSFFLLGQHDLAVETGERALAIGRAIDDFPTQVVAAHLVAFPYRLRGDFRRAINASRWVAESVRGSLIRERFGVGGYPASAARAFAAACLAELGEFTEARAYGEEAIRLAEALDHPYGLGAAQLLQGFLSFRQGRTAAAIGLLEQCRENFERWDLPQLIPEALSLLGTAYVMGGRSVAGVSLLEQAAARVDSRRIGSLIPHVALLSEGFLLTGRVEEAGRLVEGARDGARQRGERGLQADVLRLAGEIALANRPPSFEGAGAYFGQALTMAQELGMRPLQAHCHLGLGKLYRRVGRLSEAQAQLVTALGMFREMEMTFWLPSVEAEL